MKLVSHASSIAIAITLTLSSASTMAKDVVFKQSDQTTATQVCYVAATEGLHSARLLMRKSDQNFRVFQSTLTCNGLDLGDFADKYAEEALKEKSTASNRVILTPKNENVESRLCLDAVTMGERAARVKHSINSPVLCNGNSISNFVRLFRTQEVVVKLAAK